MTAQIVSKLSQFLRTGLKEGATIAGERIEREALRAGVKPEELRFAKLPIDPNKRYTLQELAELDKQRADEFYYNMLVPHSSEDEVIQEASGLTTYSDYSLDKLAGHQNYRERVTSFQSLDEPTPLDNVEKYWSDLRYARANQDWEEVERIKSAAAAEGIPGYALEAGDSTLAKELAGDEFMQKGRYASPHFEGTANYLLHSRYADDALQGKSTRMLMEVQSDLHQYARVGRSNTPESPWKESWLRKGIERELVDAHNKGVEQVAIPISETGVELTPAARELFEKTRTAYAESSKQFEEVDKLRAKQSKLKAVVHSDNATNGDLLAAAEEAGVPLDPDLPMDALLRQARRASHNLFKDTEEAYEVYRSKLKAYHEVLPLLRKENPALAHELHNSVPTNPDFYAPVDEWAQWTKSGKLVPLARGEGVQKWYETEVRDTAKKIAKATGSEFEEVVDDGVKFAVIRPTKDFTVPLYSSPVAAYFGVRTALDKGYSEEEIRAYAKDKGIDADKAISAAAKIEAARKAGYSED